MNKTAILVLLLLSSCTNNVMIDDSGQVIDKNEEVIVKQLEVIDMKLESPAFKDNELIPSKYTCDGENAIIPLKISAVPKNAVSLALVFDDPDAPAGVWDHWILWNLLPETLEINSEPKAPHGKNSWGKLNYGGPCPPDKEHTYQFKLYALDSKLELKEGSTKTQLEKAMEGHVIEKTILKGRYERK